MGDDGEDAESCEEELLEDLLINPSTFPLLFIALMLLWFWYRWGDLIVFGGVADWCLISSQTVIATWTTPLPSRTSAAQHIEIWNEIFEEKERKFNKMSAISAELPSHLQELLSRQNQRNFSYFSTWLYFWSQKAVKTSKSYNCSGFLHRDSLQLCIFSFLVQINYIKDDFEIV